MLLKSEELQQLYINVYVHLRIWRILFLMWRCVLLLYYFAIAATSFSAP